ncbi:XF1762 family protein [Streptomyces ginkgonis]|uniref:XF1762 family protein n=1 Tax=Streptomyces ginkgonis TaxID=1812259 RepID=UPI002176D366|nr:XF1762 family protein [Streptomyces ginkgonis]
MSRQMHLGEYLTPPPEDRQQRLRVVPLTLADAADAVDRWHRHHRRPQGHRFSLGVLDEAGHLRGVAIVGRPVARSLDTGYTVEVTRLASDGTRNACSALYGAAWRTAAAMGFGRIITYTQDGESGASLRAVGWRQVAVLRPRTGWDTPSRRREDRGTDRVARILWEQSRVDARPLPSLADLRNEIRNEILCPAIGCGRPFPLGVGRGRPARYCSTACRVRAHRASKATIDRRDTTTAAIAAA